MSDERFKAVASTSAAIKADKEMIDAMKRLSINTDNQLNTKAEAIDHGMNYGSYSPATGTIITKASAPEPKPEPVPAKKAPAAAKKAPAAAATKKAPAAATKKTPAAATTKNVAKAFEDYRVQRRVDKYKAICERRGVCLPSFDISKLPAEEQCKILEEALQDHSSIPLTETAIIGAAQVFENFIVDTNLGRRTGWEISGFANDVKEAVKGQLADDVEIISVKYDVALSIPVEGRLLGQAAELGRQRHYENKFKRANRPISESELNSINLKDAYDDNNNNDDVQPE